MKKYIAPELEIINFVCEDIITVSGGTQTLSIAPAAGGNPEGVATFSNGSLEYTDNNSY